MTIKEAIFKALKDLNKPVTSKEILEYIEKNNLYKFGAKNPIGVISAELRKIRLKGDQRLGILGEGRTKLYFYKLGSEIPVPPKISSFKSFHERDLHILFSTYLRNVKNIYAKTIFHEKSNKKDNTQKWLHPDMVGVSFTKFKTETINEFLYAIKKDISLSLYSFELKKEINTDSQLKEAFFQAVSNSSWANYGYLVSFHLNENLIDELSRLNQSFGIGFILLKSNPFESKILFRSEYKNIDLKTMDKLCSINSDFKSFITKIERYISAIKDHRYEELAFRDLENFCDKILNSDEEISKYCKSKSIP